MSGAWRLTFSLMSRAESGNYNYCDLYKNGNRLDETIHETYSGYGRVQSTSGRVVTLEASAGDRIEIRPYEMYGEYWYTYFCAEFIQKM